MLSLCCPKWLCLFYIQVPSTLEIGLVPLLKGGQYPGLFLFSTPARMMRPVLNLATKTKELIGSFEQVCGRTRYSSFVREEVCGRT